MSSHAGAGGGGAGRLVAGVVVGVATALVIAGLTIALFFNPAWVSFEQARSDAAAWTGWTPAEVDAVTRDLVAEVLAGPGTIAQQVAGVPVFEERERSHMSSAARPLSFYAVSCSAP